MPLVEVLLQRAVPLDVIQNQGRYPLQGLLLGEPSLQAFLEISIKQHLQDLLLSVGERVCVCERERKGAAREI